MRHDAADPALPIAVPGCVLELARIPPELLTAPADRRARQRQAGRELARAAAAQLLGGAPGSFEVAGGGDARPYLARRPPATGTATLAISHSGRWAGAAAVRPPARVGLDVQSIRLRPVGRLARYMGWATLPGAGDDAVSRDRFTQLWTLWEASVKCDDASVLGAPTAAFEHLAPALRPGTEGDWSAGPYRASTRRLDAEHWLTLVVRDEGAGERASRAALSADAVHG